jgi:L-methionine (R)-S-oxide reductase
MRERLAAILKQFAADSGTVHLMGSDGQLYLVAAIGIPDPVLNVIQTIPVGKGMAGLAAERKEPVNSCNIQSDTTGDVRPGAKATGLQGSVAIPMLVEGRVMGVLGVANHTERTFTEAEIAQLLKAAAALYSEMQPQD